MFKDLMVPMTGTSGDADALNIAIDLAADHGAHLTVMELVNLPMPVTAPWGLMPDMGSGDLYSQLRSQGEVNAARLRARLEKETLSSEVRLVESLFVEPPRTVAHCAHYVDLTVLAGALGDTGEAVVTRNYLGSLLMESGRPVLVVPPRCKTTMPPRRIVAAWRPTSEASRALHDALPLLVAAEAVDLVLVDPASGERGSGEEPGADIATHLARHGVKVNVVTRDSRGRPVSAILLEQAQQMGAHLLVAGGYGHSRLREWALGGVTRELLISAAIPVFFSH
jgi:nucleotide-binding universal stress UspA family protein